MEWKHVGFYGVNFSNLVQAMIFREIVGCNMDTLESLDKYVRDFVESLNLNDVVKALHQEVMKLQQENNALRKEKKNEASVSTNEGSIG